MKKYYTVYKITNNINDKIYIGAHETNDLNDGYMGSGTLIRRAHKKYGIENFSKEIIQFCDSKDEMYSLEKEIVNEKFLKRDDIYNLKEGGEGGWDYLKEKIPVKDKDGNTFRVSKDDKRYLSGELVHIWKGKHHSEETKKKIGKANRTSQKGEKNSQFNTMWIYSLEEKISKKIPKGSKIPDGWLKGRKINFKEFQRKNEIRIKKEKEKLRKQEKQLKKKKEKNIQREKKYKEHIEKIKNLTKYYEIYKKVGFTKFVEITNYKYSKQNLVMAFKRYLTEFVPQNGKKEENKLSALSWSI